MLFFKNRNKSKTPTISRNDIALPLYPATVSVDCFDNRVSREHVVTIKKGDNGYLRRKSSIIDSKHNDVGVFVNGFDCGFLPTIVGDCICDVFPGEDYPCTVDFVKLGDAPSLCINIMLPYIYESKNLPISVTLSSDSNSTHQVEIKQSQPRDYILVSYNEMLNKFEVYNKSIGTSIGVLSDIATEKILKKHKNARKFIGAITKISPTYDHVTLTPSILLLTVCE